MGDINDEAAQWCHDANMELVSHRLNNPTGSREMPVIALTLSAHAPGKDIVEVSQPDFPYEDMMFYLPSFVAESLLPQLQSIVNRLDQSRQSSRPESG